MAVVRTGSTYSLQSSTEDTSFAITVPSDADIIVVGLQWDYPVDDMVLNFDDGSGHQFTEAVSEITGLEAGQFFGAEIHYMCSDDANWPGTGATTLYRKTDNENTYGCSVCCFFYKNVDIDDPIKTTGTDYIDSSQSGFDVQVDTPGAVDSGDMAVVAFYNWDNAVDGDTNGQTSIYEGGNFRNNCLVVAEEVGEDHMYVSGSCDYCRMAVAVFAESSGGVSKSASDTGAGVDALGALSVDLGVADTGAGVDALGALSVDLGVADTGAGVDALGALSVDLDVADTGAGVDALGALSVDLDVADTGAGVDALGALEAYIQVSDAGVGVDGATLDAGGILKSASDTGAGVDALGALSADLGVADAGAGVDALGALEAYIQVSDAGVGVDQVAVETGAALKSASDTGAGVDALGALTVYLRVSDSGVGFDAASFFEPQFVWPEEIEEDRLAMFDDFGITATVNGEDIIGLFSDGYVESFDISGSAPHFMCTVEDAADVTLVFGAQITIPNMGVYKVTKPAMPDGAGMITFILTKVA